MTSLLLAVIYLAFIGLGLPDSLLGAAWPMIYPQFGVPVSSMGLLSMIISAGTILSSLNSSRLTRALGAGKVTLLSTALTAIALLGFGMSRSLWQLCFWAVPYGLGAGSVDAALNNYVALHYASRHMNWLHCMWGVGTIIGPSLMSAALTGGHGWSGGYLLTALVQGLIVAVLLLSLPLWGRPTSGNGSETETAALSLREVLAIPGAKEVMLCFFGYCALESTAGLWAASYLTLARDIPAETAAGFAALFYLGITAGRAVSGWIAPRLGDDGMIRLGLWGIGLGLAALLLPGPAAVSLAGLVIIGLGCAPFPGGDRGTDGQRLCGQHGYAPAVWADGPADHPGAVPLLSTCFAGSDGLDAPSLGAQGHTLHTFRSHLNRLDQRRFLLCCIFKLLIKIVSCTRSRPARAGCSCIWRTAPSAT